MAEKSIPEQIVDKFIEKLSKEEALEKKYLDQLTGILNSDSINKDKIIELLKEAAENENP